MAILKRMVSIGLSACGGGLVLYSLHKNNEDHFKVNASWTTNSMPSTKWDYNWDR